MFTKFGKARSFTGNPLIDIQIAQSKKLIILMHKSEQNKQLIQKAMIKVRDETHIKNLPTRYVNVTKFINHLKTAYLFAPGEQRNRIKEQFKLLKRIERLNKDLKMIKQQIFKVGTQSSNIKSAFITFQNPKDRDLFLKILKKRRWTCCMKKRQELMIEDKVVFAQAAPQPVNINWENYSYKELEKIKRRLISWGVYILLYLLPLMIVIIFSSVKRDLKTKKPSCYGFDPDSNVMEDSKRCFCFIKNVSERTLHSHGLTNGDCQELEDVDLYYSIASVAESICLSTISFVFDMLYKVLTKYEVHNDKNQSSISLVVKMFFWKYFTIGIFPLLSSVHIIFFKLPFFELPEFGFYDDFTALWYQEKGVGVLISSFLRIFILMGTGIFRYARYRYRVSYDQRFTGDMTVTRKTNHKEYIKVYESHEFDIQLSYAEVLTSVFIALTYGFLMPLIFFFTLLQLVVLFYRDKILNFKLYFHFSQFESTLHLYARKLMDYTIPIGGFLIIWVFGNSFFFPDFESLNPDFGTVTGSYSDSYKRFTPSRPFEFNPSENGYIASFERRAGATRLSQLVILNVLIYSIYIGVTYIVTLIWNYTSFKRITQEIIKLNKDKKKRYNVSYFEDLVSHSDILYGKTLMRVMRGREDYNDEVRRMHMMRNRRLWRNLKRDRRRMRRIRKLDIEECRVNEKNISSSKFQTLSSYDYKLHPNFRHIYIKSIIKGLLVDSDSIDSDIQELRGKKAYEGIAKLIQISQGRTSTKKKTEDLDSPPNLSLNNLNIIGGNSDSKFKPKIPMRDRMRKLLNFGMVKSPRKRRRDFAVSRSDCDMENRGKEKSDLDEQSVNDSQADMVPNFGKGDIMWDRLMMDFNNVAGRDGIDVDDMSFEDEE